MEKWKWIIGFEGYYKISDYGRIKSYKSKKEGKILSNINKKGGYLSIILKTKERKLCTRIHRIVYENFVGKINKGEEVHHINGIKCDNRLENLILLSSKEHRIITIRENKKCLDALINYNKYIKVKEIIQCDLNGKEFKKYLNAKEAERITGIKSRNILQVANKEEYKPGKTRKQSGGYIWKYNI